MEALKAMLIMIDGLRPEAVTAERCPNLMSVRARGASTFQARSVMPSITLPCHMSIFHSVPPTRHGVTTNDWSPMARPLPGLVEVVRAAQKRCAFFYNWEPLRNVSQPENLSESHFRDSDNQLDGDEWIAETVLRTLDALAGRPDFTFVYFGTVDLGGHIFGWMSEEYLAQVAEVDRLLGKVLAILPTETTVLIHSDHGGHDRTHGTDSPEDMTIPWVIAGPGIRRNYELTSPVSLLDTAPTLARVLRLTPHSQWEGRPVEEAFEAYDSICMTTMKTCNPKYAKYIPDLIQRAMGTAPLSLTPIPTVPDSIVYEAMLPTGSVIFKAIDPDGLDPDGIGLEAWMCDTVRAQGVPTPRILTVDTSRNSLPTSYFIMEKASGQPLNTLPIAQQRPFLPQIGAYLRQIHALSVEYFGWLDENHYRQHHTIQGSDLTWHSAVMKDIPEGLAYFQQNGAVE